MAVFYVDPVNGNDTNNGASWTTAYATVLRALQDVQYTTDNFNYVYIGNGVLDSLSIDPTQLPDMFGNTAIKSVTIRGITRDRSLDPAEIRDYPYLRENTVFAPVTQNSTLNVTKQSSRILESDTFGFGVVISFSHLYIVDLLSPGVEAVLLANRGTINPHSVVSFERCYIDLPETLLFIPSTSADFASVKESYVRCGTIIRIGGQGYQNDFQSILQITDSIIEVDTLVRVFQNQQQPIVIYVVNSEIRARNLYFADPAIGLDNLLYLRFENCNIITENIGDPAGTTIAEVSLTNCRLAITGTGGLNNYVDNGVSPAPPYTVPKSFHATAAFAHIFSSGNGTERDIYNIFIRDATGAVSSSVINLPLPYGEVK